MKRLMLSSNVESPSLFMSKHFHRIYNEAYTLALACVPSLKDKYDWPSELSAYFEDMTYLNSVLAKICEDVPGHPYLSVSCAYGAGLVAGLARVLHSSESVEIVFGYGPRTVPKNFDRSRLSTNHVWCVYRGVVYAKWPHDPMERVSENLLEYYVPETEFQPVLSVEQIDRKAPNIVGKIVYITNKDSWYYGEWGRVISQDGDSYYVAIADDRDSVPVFDRNEFKIKR